MNNEPSLTAEESPPTKQEIDRFCREFEECHKDFIEAVFAKQQSPHTAALKDLANRVLEKLSESLCRNKEFRDFYRAHGMMKIRNEQQWAYAIRNSIGDQFREHYAYTPRVTTEGENLLLRLAYERPDGMLFPLVRDRMARRERKLLQQLLNKKIVCEVPVIDGVGVWRADESGGSLGLRLTDKGFGSGDQTLKKLIDRGYFDMLPADDSKVVWRYERNAPVTARMRDGAREYIGALSVSVHRQDDSYSDLPDDDPAQLDQFVRFLTDGESLRHVMEHFVANGSIPAEHAEAYLLHKIGEPPNYERLTLAKVAERLGLPVDTIKHWIPKYNDLLYDNLEAQRLLLDRLRRNRALEETVTLRASSNRDAPGRIE